MVGAVCLLSVGAATSCNEEANMGKPSANSSSGMQVQPSRPVETGPLVDANNRFALKLLAVLRSTDGNFFFSPMSISTALGMTYAGARGSTASEMADALEFRAVGDDLHDGFASLLATLNPKDAPYQLAIANALWTHEKYKFRPEFLAIGQQRYGAELRPLDFEQSEAARKSINDWVAGRTNDRIRDLIPSGVLTPLTRLVLTNAIYFKGKWKEEFEPGATRNEDFFVTTDRKKPVPLMHRRDHFQGFEDGDLQIVELPYRGAALSMVVLLPRQKDGLPALEKQLSHERLSGWLGQLASTEVDLALPRFKMTSEFRLDQALRTLGMRQAFADTADFSGMDGTRDLYIQAAIHKAFVEVNEEGTEAAAATGIVVKARAIPRQPMLFRADHPFLFLIRDVRTGSILFMGRVADPA